MLLLSQIIIVSVCQNLCSDRARLLLSCSNKYMKDIVESLLYMSIFTPLVILFVDRICGQGLTWLLPERFSESEIGPEAGFVNFW